MNKTLIESLLIVAAIGLAVGYLGSWAAAGFVLVLGALFALFWAYRR